MPKEAISRHSYSESGRRQSLSVVEVARDKQEDKTASPRHAKPSKSVLSPFRRTANPSSRHFARRSSKKANAGEPALVDLEWHPSWLARQRANLPHTVTHLLRVQGAPVSDDKAFRTLWTSVDTYLNDIEHRGFSIDDLIDHLDSTNVFDNADTQTIGEKRLLVFAVLGWQSMIYQPAFNTRPSDQLAVKRDDDVDSGLVFESYTADAELCDRPLYVLLKGFGNLLPARASNMRPAAATECSKVAASWTPLYPTELNAYLLHTLLNVEFRWVDTLALHLDYDKSSRTLSLFAYPSVCAEARRTGRGAIFAFSSTEGKSALDPRADEKDIEGFLGEVILSFRLLFGQSRKSRKLFRHLFNTAKTPIPQPDNFLVRLCSEVSVCCAAKDAPAWTAPDQPVYYAARHFPVLYERVELLAKELQAAKPKSMVHLLRDRRDTLQFWTFWFVAIFGTIGIILSMVQVALQAVQLAQEASRM